MIFRRLFLRLKCLTLPQICLLYTSSTDKKELETALDQLIEQKPLVYSYLVDESADEVVAGNASMALVYSGEAAYAESLSKDLDYSVPEEGSNMWIDSWLIAKTCKHQENAEKFLDFLCREDIAMKNFEYEMCIRDRYNTYSASLYL